MCNKSISHIFKGENDANNFFACHEKTNPAVVRYPDDLFVIGSITVSVLFLGWYAGIGGSCKLSQIFGTNSTICELSAAFCITKNWPKLSQIFRLSILPIRNIQAKDTSFTSNRCIKKSRSACRAAS